jgi:hypothetical protein
MTFGKNALDNVITSFMIMTGKAKSQLQAQELKAKLEEGQREAERQAEAARTAAASSASKA